MGKEQEKLTGLEGGTAQDAAAAAVAEGLKKIREEIGGVAARVAVFEDKEVLKTVQELLELKDAVEGLSALENKIPEDRSEEIDKLKAKLDGVQAQLLSGAAAPGGQQKPKSIGEVVFEDEGFQAMISKDRSATTAFKINLSKQRADGALSIPDILSGVSAAPVLGAADLAALRWSTRQTTVVTEPKESVAAFVPAIGTIPAPGFQVYEWQKETLDSATGYLRTTLVNPIDGDPTPKTSCDVADASHFVPGTYVRFFDASRNLLGRVELVSVDDVSTPNTLTFATDALDWDQAADTNVTSEYWLGTPESEGKPYTLLAGETDSVNAVTIAIMAAVTRQQLLSPSGIQAWIEQELPDRTIRNVAQQLLYGAGTTGKSLLGFWNYSGAQTYAWSEGEAGDNRIDAILRGALLVVGGSPSVVMNKRDLRILRLLKDTNDGQYLHSQILGKISMEMVGGQWVLDGQYPIILSDAVKDGDFLICDFATASKIIDANDESLEWGVINDDFALNQRRARYERTLAHAIQRRLSFVLGEWDNAPTP
jgi:hypothetical protein